MKRVLAFTLSAAMALSLLCACSDTGSQNTVVPSGPPEETESVQPTPTPTPRPTPTPEPSAEPSAEPAMAPAEETDPGASQVPETPAPTPAPTPKPTPQPTPKPTPAPAATHHPEPEQTHHVEETHHPEPEPTHHPEETHHPEPEPTHHPEDDHSGDATPAPAGGVDLAAFYGSILAGDENFRATEALTGEFLDNFYPGLSAIPLRQRQIYIPMMTSVVCEIAMVEVENASDVPAVKAIFQARIDYQTGDGKSPGGAYYPMSIEGWMNNSRIVSNGNFVMMVAYSNCDSIVTSFNALF